MSPPTSLRHFSPIFTVGDLSRALAHYRALGFVTHAYAGGEEYGFADRDGIGVHLAAEAGHDPELGASETYLYVDDADALYTEWTGRGIGGITRPVVDTPYQLREGAHIDPDGNVIRFGSAMPERTERQRLQSHLASHYSIDVAEVSQLDLGVFRVERRDGASWVARVFPARRPLEAVAGDAEILHFLAEKEFPAERCATQDATSVLDGHAVLVTQHIEGVGRQQRRTAIRNLGGLRSLGELLGRLHTLPATGEGVSGGALGAPGRPGGAWHHVADGTPGEELAAAATLLGAAEGVVGCGARSLYQQLRDALDTADAGDGLPEAFLHPDFVLANVVASGDPHPGLVLVDWTGAGRGARLWSLAFFLFAEGAKDLRRVDRAVAGYRRHVDLEPEELSRLAAVARSRPMVLAAWSFYMGRKHLADAAREMAEITELAEAVGARARSAFAA